MIYEFKADDAWRFADHIGIRVKHKGDELVFFGLLEEHRGMGLSAQLLGEAVSIARKNGISQLRIEREISHPAAKHMLENYGFHDGKMNILPSVL